ncbi:MAG: hypothetical protein HY749_22120 [Gammaproteobacteria bacterium]|nr:hypothetical protein [Gammaproteobacteria bacterium]MBI5615433.1 hypothetical protein [Gammaproteobacteria bacterium]
MTFFEALLSPEALFAILLFALGALVEPFLAHGLQRRCAPNPPLAWLAEHVLAPLLRAALLFGFVLLAYPALFGLRSAPPLATLVADPHAHPSTVLGVMLLVTLSAPLLRLFARHLEVVLPLQGVLATAFLFHWLASYLHVTVASAWPGLASVLLLVGLAYFAGLAASLIGRALGASLNAGFHLADGEALAASAATLLAQVPLVLLYGAMLGRQLAI